MTKNKYLFVILTAIIFMSFVSPENEAARYSIGEHLRTVGRYGCHLYGLNNPGSTVVFPENSFEYAGVDFRVNHQIPKKDLYKILHDIANKLIRELNSDPKITPYMHNHRFDLSNINITLIFEEKPGERVYHPDLEIARLTCGKYYFLTVDPEKRSGYKTCEEQEFDLKLLEE